MKRKLLLFTFLFTCSLFAQKRAAVWYFGQNAGLSFKESTPAVLDDGQLNSAEGCASISDFEGNLLFYTDGNKIWNRQHEVMFNGDSVGILSSTSTTQSSIIVPNPVDKKKYYVFTVANYGNYYGLRYSVVDMSLDNGKGAVLNPKAVLLETPVAEKITAVKNYNGTGYWVIAHGINNNNFYSYYISSGGLAGSPVVSSVGSVHASGQGTLGYMKASPNGKYIACAVNTPGRFLEVLDFNNETGQVSVNTPTETRKISYGNFTPYGLDFSPNSSRLYVSINSVFGSGTPTSYICQYNMDMAFNDLLFASGENRLQAIYPIHALQTAPNGKIYVAKNSQYLDVINNPNTAFPNFNYQSDALNLGNSRIAVQGLPNFVQNYLISPKIKISDSCEGDTTVFSYQLEKPDSAVWLFNDPGSSQTSSASLIGKHKYSYPGEYLLQLIIYSGVSVDTIRQTINILPKPLLNLGSDTTLCKGSSLLLNPNLMSASYVWHDNKTISSYLVDKAGVYSVKASVKGCSAYDTLIVAYNSPSVELSVGSPEQCLNENNFNFELKSKDELKSILWDFGDNSFSNLRSPSHRYAYPKEFEVVLKITDNAGCIARDTALVKVLSPVSADFTINSDSQCLTGQNFHFSAGGSANPNLSSLAYHFGDGGTSSLAISSHKFSQTGNYNVMLITKSTNGCQDTSSKAVFVYDGPLASFSLDQTEQCLKDNLFSVNNSSSAPVSSIESYSFDFGDGTILKEEKPAYTYALTGEYGIELTVKDNHGCISKTQQKVKVKPSPIVAFGTMKPSACLGTEPVRFVNNTTISSGSVSAYHWNFGDGTESDLENPVKTYGEGKVYVVYLEATSDLGCKANASIPITTYERPDADFSIQLLKACEADNSVNLINGSKIKGNQSLSYLWTIEDNQTNQTSISAYKFKKAGKHKISLRAVSSHGCADTAVKELDINPQPELLIKLNNRYQCFAENSFSPQADAYISSGSIDYLNWTLSDGRSFSGSFPKFKFTERGEYTLKLTAGSDKGCTAQKDILLKVFAQPKVDFSVSDICLNEPLIPVNNSSIEAGSIIGYSWNMGDNTIIGSRTAEHKYTEAGSYTIDLTVISDEGCKSEKSKTVLVKEVPQVDFTVQKSGWENNRTMYEFTASNNIPAFTYSWKINSLQAGTGQNVRLPFSDTGLFKVQLEVTGSNSCSDTKEKEVFVVPPFYIEFPNSFTPNKDGLNDQFGPIGAEYHRSYEMIIYNRWGSILFHTYDPSHHWGGLFFEQEAPAGVYYYYVKVVDFDGVEREFSNSLLLLR